MPRSPLNPVEGQGVRRLRLEFRLMRKPLVPLSGRTLQPKDLTRVLHRPVELSFDVPSVSSNQDLLLGRLGRGSAAGPTGAAMFFAPLWLRLTCFVDWFGWDQPTGCPQAEFPGRIPRHAQVLHCCAPNRGYRKWPFTSRDSLDLWDSRWAIAVFKPGGHRCIGGRCFRANRDLSGSVSGSGTMAV
jgi:hypothetical protein